MKIQDVMSREVVTCHPWDSMGSAVRRMWEADVGCLPVVDADGRVVGMVTDRDLLMSTWFQGQRLDELAVDGAMAHRVQGCRPDEAVERALERMSTHQVRRLPVLDDEGRPLGVVSLNDVARRCDASGRPRNKSVVHTLAQVCAPRARELACRAPGGELAASS